MVGIQVLHQYEGHATSRPQVLQELRKSFQPSRRRPNTRNQQCFFGTSIPFQDHRPGVPVVTVRHRNPGPNSRSIARFAAYSHSFGFWLPGVFLFGRHKARSETGAVVLYPTLLKWTLASTDVLNATAKTYHGMAVFASLTRNPSSGLGNFGRMHPGPAARMHLCGFGIQLLYNSNMPASRTTSGWAAATFGTISRICAR